MKDVHHGLVELHLLWNNILYVLSYLCDLTSHVCLVFSQYGTTPLIWAARKGHYESVMHLLSNGADVDQEGAVSKP